MQQRRGFTVFFTGLPGAGKLTLAKALAEKLLALGLSAVTMLDGDEVREHLSGELGFSKADRDRNVRRIGYVASEVTRHRGVAICTPIAPYHATRLKIRKMIEAFFWGGLRNLRGNSYRSMRIARPKRALRKSESGFDGAFYWGKRSL